MKLITVEVIDHKDQRYNTVGDWQFGKDGCLNIKVSKMTDDRYHKLIAIHEIIEALSCYNWDISQEKVDYFDTHWKEHDGITEPGEDKRAPYYIQHQFAMGIERLLAAELGVNWHEYEKEINEK